MTNNEILIVRNGRYVATREDKDIYYMLNSFAGVKAGTPEALVAFKLQSVPRNLTSLVESIDKRRKNNRVFDKFFGDSTVEEIIENLTDHGFITKYTGKDMREAQLRFLNGILLEPSARPGTPDRKIYEKIDKISKNEDLDYVLGRKRPDSVEELVYSRIYGHYTANMQTSMENPYPVPGTALSLQDIREADLDSGFEPDKYLKTLYSLINKNMFCIYPASKQG